MPARSFISVLRDHAKQVVKLENTQADDFLKLLRQTESEITGRLFTFSDKDTAFSTFQLQQILGEVKSAIGTLESKANTFYGSTQQDAIDLAVQHTVDEITHLSTGALDDVSLNLSFGAVSGMSDPAQALLANHFETSVQRYGADVLNQVRRRVQMGMITGEPTRNVVADVQQSISGTQWKAKEIVRTETSHAYGAAQHRSIDEASKSVPGLMKMWVHQSSYPCPVCIKLDGTERPMDGTWTIQLGKKTKTIAHAPAHPNCTCRVTAMKPKWKSALKKLGYLDDAAKR